MKIIVKQKKVRRKMKGIMKKCMYYVLPTLLYSPVMLADSGVIPTPPDSEQLNGNNDFIDILINLMGQKIGPLLIYGASIFLIVKAIFTIMNGVKEAQRKDDWGEMKSSVTAAGVMVTVGLILAFTGHSIFTSMAAGNS